MVRSIAGLALFAMAALACPFASAWAEDLGIEIDLGAFSRPAGETPAVWDGVPLEDVSRRFGSAPRQFYLSGMIGPSFASVANPDDATFASSDTLFNAGGALGIAFDRQRGRLRAEVEGMGRSSYDAQMFASPSPNDFSLLTNNWSVMTNLWRDVMFTGRFGGYGGGGIGAGGYMLGERLDGITEYANPDSNFAWQFGGGLLWDLTDRLTFDVGYRYFHIDTIRQAGVEPNQFAASELMFTLRLYEPFRALHR